MRFLDMAPIALTVSLNNFYYWHQDKALSQILSWIVPLYTKKIDGFEISLPFNQCQEWIENLKSNSKCLPRLYNNLSTVAQEQIVLCNHNSIHLEDIKNLPLGNESLLAEHLNQISQLTGIYNYTTHPDEVDFSRWAQILCKLDRNIKLSIENMCKRKSNFKSLDEIIYLLNEYDNIYVTFDTSHWLEQGLTLTDPQIKSFVSQFAERISKIHLSAPSSDCKSYQYSPLTSHYAFVDSDYHNLYPDLIELFNSTSCLVTLEGLVPVQSVDILDKEVDFIQNLIYQAHSKYNQNQLIA